MNLRRLIRISILASILSILSVVTIPIGPVPVTLQTLGVLLCGYILGIIDGTISVIIYILLGFAGLPVFSGYKSGIEVLLGPTGGYILAFIPAALISGYSAKKYNSFLPMFIWGLICILTIYLIGAPYLSLSAGISLQNALKLGVYPFIIPDTIKIIISVLLSIKIRSRLIKANII